ncbi:argininosuccinate synthase [Colletotrichum orchidophilum]|uniref:Argininosuccinate synthase n=1 Tax=Colletotrichum orchidophilum TaxID=1209926 RepID=A0A1G4B3N9_9PEZI|nr:argininosuccinate synthase [Colletotrichum orchidophilum]OHE96017.1 argininosuccinate synthase [Colletotrichum orchidophilum]
MAGEKGKVCLAYSGGLDTSTILAWLLEQGYSVVCYLANVGQEEALQIGAEKMIIDDLKREFVEELCWKAVHLARPIIARGQMKAAAATGPARELAFYTINPEIKVIAPWRDPTFFNRFQGRNDLLDYAAEKGIPVTSTKAKPYSMHSTQLTWKAHCSYEAGMLEDPDVTPPEDMWTKTVSPLKAPDTPLDITIHFDKGIPVKVITPQQTATDAVELFGLLNAIGKEHAVGRIDIVENRMIGLKSRGCYDSPAMTILRLAHISLEGLVMDGRVRALRDLLSKQWSELLYNGSYFSPEREFLQPSLDHSQQRVNGEVRLRLYKGNAYCLGRKSNEKLYSEEDASMDSLTTFDPSETSGFITINAIRLKKFGLQKAEAGIEF